MFFMDIFFVTKQAKSVRGFSMMQLFVSDKGFVKVYGMKGLTEIPLAVKMFAKEVGAPNAFVCDPHRNQKSQEVRNFCNKIGSTLRVLEEGTQASNRAELIMLVSSSKRAFARICGNRTPRCDSGAFVLRGGLQFSPSLPRISFNSKVKTPTSPLWVCRWVTFQTFVILGGTNGFILGKIWLSSHF
jgi:hypothetical protein